MNIEKRYAEIKARKAEIRKLIEGDSENKLDMDELEKELRELYKEEEGLVKRMLMERMLNDGSDKASPIPGLVNPLIRSNRARRRTTMCSIAPHGSRPCRVSR